jgi:hypothetical protein
MLLAPYSRFFLRHELRFRTPYGHGIPLPFLTADKKLDVHNVLQEAIKKNKANLVLRNKDIVRLTTMEVHAKEKIAALIFRRSDPAAATPIFENEKTRKLRPADKKVDEAVAVSAHLFISLDQVPDAAYPSYAAVLEEVPGLSRTYVQALLHDVLKETEYEYTDGRGKKKTTYTMVEFHGHKSEKVGGALEQDSSVPSIILVRPGNVKGLDTEGLVVAREERMKLVLRAKPEQTLKLIAKIQKWMGKTDWSRLLVEMSLPDNRKRLVALAREADASDILFVRSVPVDVKTKLEACTDVINKELLAKAQEIFASDKAGK